MGNRWSRSSGYEYTFGGLRRLLLRAGDDGTRAAASAGLRASVFPKKTGKRKKSLCTVTDPYSRLAVRMQRWGKPRRATSGVQNVFRGGGPTSAHHSASLPAQVASCGPSIPGSWRRVPDREERRQLGARGADETGSRLHAPEGHVYLLQRRIMFHNKKRKLGCGARPVPNSMPRRRDRAICWVTLLRDCRRRLWANRRRLWANRRRLWANRRRLWANRQRLWANRRRMWADRWRLWSKQTAVVCCPTAARQSVT